MATVSIDVPDIVIPDLTQALARELDGSTDSVTQAIVAKVLAGQTTTAAEKQSLARAFMKDCARRALIDYRAQLAAEASRTENASTW